MTRFLLSVFLIVVLMSSCTNKVIKYDADDARIQYCGRYYTERGVSVFAYSGVSLKLSFVGTNLKVMMTDYGCGGDYGTNHFLCQVDNEEPFKFCLTKFGEEVEYTLVDNLKEGEHTLCMTKLTEAQVGKVGINGFIIEKTNPQDGLLLKQDNNDIPSIEFVGNSITCGYGNEVSTFDPDSIHFHSCNENITLSYGYLTAKELGWTYNCVAYSGRGLLQNNDGTKYGVVPSLYDLVVPDDTTHKFNHTLHNPKVIVINLGTNDMYAETIGKSKVDSFEFVNAYLSFIEELRMHHPESIVILCAGPMLSDSYPSGKNQYSRLKKYIDTVMESRHRMGDTKVYTLFFEPQTAPYGEDWHPSKETHRKMSETLVRKINEIILK